MYLSMCHNFVHAITFTEIIILNLTSIILPFMRLFEDYENILSLDVIIIMNMVYGRNIQVLLYPTSRIPKSRILNKKVGESRRAGYSGHDGCYTQLIS